MNYRFYFKRFFAFALAFILMLPTIALADTNKSTVNYIYIGDASGQIYRFWVMHLGSKGGEARRKYQEFYTANATKEDPKVYIEREDGKVVNIGATLVSETLVGVTIDDIEKEAAFIEDDIGEVLVGETVVPILDNSGTEASTPITVANKALLKAAIEAARNKLASVETSTDGKDMYPSQNWATAGNKASYDAAITSAANAASNPDITQVNVDNALVSLTNATTTFDSQISSGSRPVVTDDEKVADAKTALTFDIIKGINSLATAITGNLNLPGKVGTYEAEVTWSSNNTEVISNTGVVSRPKDAAAVVVLTATIKLGTAQDTKQFQLTVSQMPVDEGSLLKEDANALKFDAIKLNNEAEDNIVSDLNLVTVGAIHKSNISWSSSDSNVISATGKVTRPAYGTADAKVKLTATISRGTSAAVVSETKEFELTVKMADPVAVDDATKVAQDKAALTFDAIKGTNTAENAVTVSLNLITTGTVNGSNISWASSNTNVITNAGVVTRPDADTTVTLTATISRGTPVVSDTQVFTLTVLKAESTTGNVANIAGVAFKDNTVSSSAFDVVVTLDNATTSTLSENDFVVTLTRSSNTVPVSVKSGSMTSADNKVYTFTIQFNNTSDYIQTGDTVTVAAATTSSAILAGTKTSDPYVYAGGSTVTNVTATVNPNTLTDATGSITITLDKAVTGLATSDITVKKGGTSLTLNTDYTITSISTTSVAIKFETAAGLVDGNSITVAIAKTGFTVNDVTVPVSITTVDDGLAAMIGVGFASDNVASSSSVKVEVTLSKEMAGLSTADFSVALKVRDSSASSSSIALTGVTPNTSTDKVTLTISVTAVGADGIAYLIAGDKITVSTIPSNGKVKGDPIQTDGFVVPNNSTALNYLLKTPVLLALANRNKH